MSNEFTVITRSLRNQRPSAETYSIIVNKLQELIPLNKTDGRGFSKWVDDEARLTNGNRYIYRYWSDTESALAWIDFASAISGDSTLNEMVIITDPTEISAIHLNSITV